jgi:hypothetical protein
VLRSLAFAAVTAALTLGAARAQDGCDAANCRKITAAEDAAHRTMLRALVGARPTPDPARWERAATSDGMREREAHLAQTARTFGQAGQAQLFHACEPTWKGCFPSQTQSTLTVGYQAKGSGAKTEQKAKRAKPGSIEALMELGQAVADSMQYGVSLSIRLVPHPADNGCFQGEGYPRPVERKKDFLHELYDADGQATASLVFGERACEEPEDYPEVNGRTPLAPVRAVVVEVQGPSAEVKKLIAAIDRQPFAARLGPVVR